MGAYDGELEGFSVGEAEGDGLGAFVGAIVG